MNLVSVVIPAYNESECVAELVGRLAAVFDAERGYQWECIVVENGSTDDTWAKLVAVHQADRRFKVVRLARTFRMDGGLTAGLAYARGEACVLMTADLQDPPEMIPQFLRLWEQGYQNVYGVVVQRQGVGWARRMNSKVFYWLAGKASSGRLPEGASDFRLLDRVAYEAVRQLEERNRFVRGLVAWVGFRSIGVPMERPPRFAGESKARTLPVIGLALKGIFAHSYLPLRAITLFGLGVSVVSMVALVVSAVLWFAVGVPFPGFGSLIALVLLLFGGLAFMLGVVSEYVGLIYEEVKQRPNFIVSETLGL